ncbi:glycosyltransferase family 9 protein [Roseospirillum parvum]|uniref:ADP-heptose:LPS heptosyltransferase n=1 Tax=Roseospirillum parvum TaxID=83401 RepID=A0A1G7U146_9PROT|nr:glycosyltransferase family 9 protein [Roseospirillum parvum]SDG41322.1 ADP-heptose:LPS heptosyltransferase [Roseospirillum parvum]
MSRLLFVTSTRIGDAVLSLGVLDRLIAEMDGPRVTVACGPAPATLFRAVPGLTRVIALPKKKRGGHWWDLWRQVATTRWDTVVDLRRSALAWLVPARRRLILPAEVAAPEHRVRHIARLLGSPESPPAPRLWATPEDRAEAARRLPEGPLLALGPTANWPAKVWPAERFAELARRLTGSAGPLPGAPVAVFGGPGEEAQAAPLLAALEGLPVVDLVGRVDLTLAGACLGRAALYVGNDSALMHLAAAAGVPTLGLFGPTREVFYGPWGTRAAVARTDTPFLELFPPGYDWHDGRSLMTSLPVDKAEAAARALLAGPGAAP